MITIFTVHKWLSSMVSSRAFLCVASFVSSVPTDGKGGERCSNCFRQGPVAAALSWSVFRRGCVQERGVRC